MLMKAKPPKKKSNKLLRQVGLWATIWWGVSGLYFVLFVWLARNYVQNSVFAYQGSDVSTWHGALRVTFNNHGVLQLLAVMIVLGWIVGGIAWLQALKQADISYRDGFKDLFLTIR
jgi:hypothetical protein